MKRAAQIPIDPAAVREQCARILAHTVFCHSKRSSDLLKYIVEKTLDGHHECLKERIIGIEVLGRSPSYDTNLDTSVRSALTDVRQRLHRYYDLPEHRQELCISLPVGAYIADFKQHKATTRPSRFSFLRKVPQRFYRHALLVVIVLFLILGGWRFFAPAPAIDRFWAPLLDSTSPITISIGSPAADPLPASAPNSLPQYIAQQTNYPIAELNAANSIQAFLAQHGNQSSIRLSNSTNLAELHHAPVIVLGNFSNQWAISLGRNLRFQSKRKDNSDRLHWIEDTANPSSQHWALNLDAPYDQVENEYALITRSLDQTTGQWWVGIAGLSVLGTLAAEQTLLDPKAMASLTSSLPVNWTRKNLQIVLEIKLVNGSPGATRPVATYCW